MSRQPPIDFKEEAEKLIDHLSEKTYQHAKEICAYVKKNFNINYSVSGMTDWLQGNVHEITLTFTNMN